MWVCVCVRVRIGLKYAYHTFSLPTSRYSIKMLGEGMGGGDKCGCVSMYIFVSVCGCAELGMSVLCVRGCGWVGGQICGCGSVCV